MRRWRVYAWVCGGCRQAAIVLDISLGACHRRAVSQGTMAYFGLKCTSTRHYLIAIE